MSTRPVADYPPPPGRRDLVEEHHCHAVRDPFRALETTDDPEVREWIRAENQLTRRYLHSLPQRAELRR